MMVVSYGTVPIGDRLRLSIRRTGQPEGDDVRRKGTVLHSILQNVVSSDDVEQAVEDAVVSGDVSVREKDGIVAKLKNAIASVSGRRWFDSAEDEIGERTGGPFVLPLRIPAYSPSSILRSSMESPAERQSMPVSL